MKKILFITGWLSPWCTGGPGNVFMNIANELAANSSYEIVVYGTVPWNCKKSIYNFYNKNITFKMAPAFWGRDGFFDSFAAHLYYCYQLILAKEHFDFVHFNILPGLRSGLIPFLLRLKKSRAKRILNFHGIPSIEAYTFSDSVLTTIGSTIHWKISRNQLNHFDKIIVNSHWMLNVCNQLGIDKMKLAIIPNGINAERFSLKKKSSIQSTSSLVILSIASGFYPAKGQDLLIQAFSKTNAKTFSRLYLVGRHTYFQEYCERLSKTLGLLDKVSFVGPQSRSMLIIMMSAADIYVHPSRYEPFGITILEAMAASNPVIATCIGGTIDYINDGSNGVLINPNNIDAFAKAIDRLASDPLLRQALGNNAHKIGEKYDWSNIIVMYEELYTRLLS